MLPPGLTLVIKTMPNGQVQLQGPGDHLTLQVMLLLANNIINDIRPKNEVKADNGIIPATADALPSILKR